MDVNMFWSVGPDDSGFDPIKYPEIKPYLARSLEDDELGLRQLFERPEQLLMERPRRRRHRRRLSRRDAS